MSWVTGLPVGVKVVSRIRACLIEGGAVKVSMSEAMTKLGTHVHVALGAGESAGMMRLLFGEEGIWIKKYKKGGGRAEVRFEASYECLAGLTVDMMTLEVVSIRGGEVIVSLPKKVVMIASAPGLSGGGGVGAGGGAAVVARPSEALNMVSYLKKKGHKATRLGLNNYQVNNERLTKIEALSKVNQLRKLEGLRSLTMAEVE